MRLKFHSTFETNHSLFGLTRQRRLVDIMVYPFKNGAADPGGLLKTLWMSDGTFYKVSALFLSITKSRSPWFMSLYNWAEGGNELKFIGLSKCHKVLPVLVPVSHIATTRRRKKVQRSISARLGQLLMLWLCSRIIIIFKRVNNIRDPHKVGWAGAVLEGVGSSPAWGLPDVNRRRWGHLTKLTK